MYGHHRAPWGTEAYKQGNKLRQALNDTSDSAVQPREELKQKVLETLAVPKNNLPAFDQRVIDNFTQSLNTDTEDMMRLLCNIPSVDGERRLPDILGTYWGSGPMWSLRDIESQMEVRPQLNEYQDLLEMLGR